MDISIYSKRNLFSFLSSHCMSIATRIHSEAFDSSFCWLLLLHFVVNVFQTKKKRKTLQTQKLSISPRKLFQYCRYACRKRMKFLSSTWNSLKSWNNVRDRRGEGVVFLNIIWLGYAKKLGIKMILWKPQQFPNWFVTYAWDIFFSFPPFLCSPSPAPE